MAGRVGGGVSAPGVHSHGAPGLRHAQQLTVTTDPTGAATAVIDGPPWGSIDTGTCYFVALDSAATVMASSDILLPTFSGTNPLTDIQLQPGINLTLVISGASASTSYLCQWVARRTPIECTDVTLPGVFLAT